MSDNNRTPPVYLSTAELAELLKMSTRGLEKMRCTGRGPRYVRLGEGGKAKVLYDLADVKVWLEKHKR
jgi:hypothetical protein